MQKRICHFRSLLKNVITKWHIVFLSFKMTCRFLLRLAASKWVKWHVIFWTSENYMLPSKWLKLYSLVQRHVIFNNPRNDMLFFHGLQQLYVPNDMSFFITDKTTCRLESSSSCRWVILTYFQPISIHFQTWLIFHT